MKEKTKKKSKKVIVLIPCYNEELTITNVINDFKRELKEIKTIGEYEVDGEVVVFDNASTDGSAAKISKTKVKSIYESNRGKGNVVRSMFEKIDSDVYVLADADSTYSAKDLKKLVEPILIHNVDMVVGDRLSSTYFTENKRPFHNFGNKLVNALININYHTNIKDTMTGYRSLSKSLAKSLIINYDGFEVETEMTIFALKHHFRILTTSISYKDRPKESPSKLNTYKDGIKVLMLIFKEFFRTACLGIFTLVALAALLLTNSFKIVALILFIGVGLTSVYKINEGLEREKVIKTVKDVQDGQH